MKYKIKLFLSLISIGAIFTSPFIDCGALAQSGDGAASGGQANTTTTPADGSSNQLPIPMTATNDVRLRFGAGSALVTLNTISRYGFGKSTLYSKPGQSLEVDAVNWLPYDTLKIGFGLSSSVQSLAFAKTADGVLDRVELMPMQLDLGAYVSNFPGFHLGIVSGIHNDVLPIVPPLGQGAVGLASTIAYGLDLGYFYALSDLWKLGGRFKQFLTESAKVKGVKIERGAGYCGQFAIARSFAVHSAAVLAYRFCNARQDSEFSRIERLQDSMTIAYDTLISW